MVDNTCSCKLKTCLSECSVVHECHKICYVEYRRPGALYLEVTWSCGTCLLEQRELEVYSKTSPVARETNLDRESSEIVADPLSTAFVDRLQSWIHHCDKSHSLCTTFACEVLPKRVLDVRADEANDTIRLVEGVDRRRGYAALSYCWGGIKPPMTTLLNRKGRESSISMSELPVIYRDAITLARALDITHLWIDALCIVQDDPQEYGQEASRMGQIFRNAYLVLLAAVSENLNQGFLHNRERHLWHDISQRNDNASVCREIREAIVHWMYNKNACDDLPVSQRGWCYQERLMARRCLIFTDIEAVWECRQACEAESMSPRPGYVSGYKSQMLPVLLSHPISVDPRNRHFASFNDAYSYWMKSVDDYSRRSFSFVTDRLLALTALANVAHAATGSEYLAGLWRDDLLRQLLWTPLPIADPPNLPFKEYIAPPWSWASCSRPGLATQPRQRREVRRESD